MIDLTLIGGWLAGACLAATLFAMLVALLAMSALVLDALVWVATGRGILVSPERGRRRR